MRIWKSLTQVNTMDARAAKASEKTHQGEMI